jgi:hypothetical protein
MGPHNPPSADESNVPRSDQNDPVSRVFPDPPSADEDAERPF